MGGKIALCFNYFKPANGFALLIVLICMESQALRCEDLLANSSSRASNESLTVRSRTVSRLREDSVPLNLESATAQSQKLKALINDLKDIRLQNQLNLGVWAIETIAVRAVSDAVYGARLQKFLDMMVRQNAQEETQPNAERNAFIEIRKPVMEAYLAFMYEISQKRMSLADGAFLSEGNRFLNLVHDQMLDRMKTVIFPRRFDRIETVDHINILVSLMSRLSELPYLVEENPAVAQILFQANSFATKSSDFTHKTETFFSAVDYFLYAKPSSTKALQLAVELFERISLKDEDQGDSVYLYLNKIFAYERSVRQSAAARGEPEGSLTAALLHFGLIETGRKDLPKMLPPRFTRWMSKLTRIEATFRRLSRGRDELAGWSFNQLAKRMAADLPKNNVLLDLAWKHRHGADTLFTEYLAFLKSSRGYGWPVNMVAMVIQSLYVYSESGRPDDISLFISTLKAGKSSRIGGIRTAKPANELEALSREILKILSAYTAGISDNKSVDQISDRDQGHTRYPDGTAFLVAEMFLFVESVSFKGSNFPDGQPVLVEALKFISSRLVSLLLDGHVSVHESVAIAIRSYRELLENRVAPEHPTTINFIEIMNGLGIN